MSMRITDCKKTNVLNIFFVPHLDHLAFLLRISKHLRYIVTMAVLLYASKVATIMTLVGAEYFRRGINRELLAVRFTSTNYFAGYL